MISGISRGRASLIGLSVEDRRAMALVSKACLTNGLPDQGAEIHELLAACTEPLGDWLPIPEVVNGGLSATTLIEPEEGIPTPEAEDLAGSFFGLTAGLEEQIFARFMEILAAFPQEPANDYYTLIREFVVRHPQRDALHKHLADAGIGSLIHYPIPPHRQQAYAEAGFAAADFPLASRMADEVLSLPMGPQLGVEQADVVVAAVRRCALACNCY